MEKLYKECPFCKNEIDISRNICPYCNESLNNNSLEGTKKSEQKNINKTYANKKDDNIGEIEDKENKNLSPEEKALKKANNYIYNAATWGLLSLLVTLIIYIMNITNGENNSFVGSSVFNLIDYAYLGVLVFFLYKKNRMAAIFLLLGHITSSVGSVIMGYEFKSFRLIIMYCLLLGVIGSFKYHKLTNQKNLSTSEIVILVIGLLYTIIGTSILIFGYLINSLNNS